MPPQDGAPNKDTNLGSMQKMPLRNVAAAALVAGRRQGRSFAFLSGVDRWPKARAKLRFSHCSDTMIEIIEDKNNN
ncbi:unnamed protein product [Musa acuminata subsp. malaccensis]|uniref:(wild Malaysian banana) hypothetical protein n=1 Tax=Musa acuminata subsp. malaccensis TaxID=214687 RepID=A0A8D7APZ2_MUSAM|nr:unnamed protein product [Musa acuminata subsp. malaccensis]